MLIKSITFEPNASSPLTRLSYLIDSGLSLEHKKSFLKFVQTYSVVVKGYYRTETYSPFVIEKGRIMFPRFLLRPVCRYLKTLGLQCEYEARNWDNAELEIDSPHDLWPEKRHLATVVCDQIKRTGGACLNLNTGKGKTILLCEIISRISLKTVIFCTSKTLKTQMIADIIEFTGMDPGRIGSVGGGVPYSGFDNHDIYVVMADTARRIPPADFSVFGFSVFDEVHQYSATKRRIIMANCCSQYMFGLSATVTKDWDWSGLLHRCGEYIDGDKIIPDEPFKCAVKAIHYRGPPEFTKPMLNVNDTVCCAYMADQFADDVFRNELIAKEVKRLVDEGLNPLIFTTTKKHILTLFETFSAMYPECSAGFITGDVGDVERARIRSECQAIFSLYICCGTGFNEPRIKSIVVAGPYKTNGKQINGRAFRGKNDDIQRQIVDIIDVATSLKSQYAERLVVYHERGFDVNVTYINHKTQRALPSEESPKPA